MNEYLSDQIMFFKQENLSHITNIPLCDPTISHILNTSVFVNINEVRLIKTDKGVSNSGNKITGAKLIVTFKIEGKITYISEESIKNIYGVKFEIIKSRPIIVPEEKGEKNILNLYKENNILVVPYVEGVHSRKIDSNTIYTILIILLDANICL